MKSPVLALLTLTAALPLGGCCSMARLFCGPDRSPWVPIAYDSPRAALATFLEAARRDDAVIAYRSLSADHKARLRREHGLGGSLVAALAWEHLKKEVPLHLLGYAAVGEPERRTADGATFVVAVEGHDVRIDLVRQPYWSVQFAAADGTAKEAGGFLRTLNGNARIQPADEDEASRLTLDPIVFPHEGSEQVTVDQLIRAEIGCEWKVDRIGPVPQR